jgi:ABC-type branched-subunit amino acid transport system substrate-binding protein
VGYVNTSLPFGTVNVGPLALGMKDAHVDGLYLPLDETTSLAIFTAAQQAGVQVKVAVADNGYGQELLDQPSALAAAQGAYFNTPYAPVEINSPATKSLQAALAKYAGFTGIPNAYGEYEGWISTDAMIKGLELAGPNLTRPGFITNLRTLTDYDAGGLVSPINFSQFGVAPLQTCSWFVKVQGHAFIPVSTQPICGTLIPDSNQLK